MNLSLFLCLAVGLGCVVPSYGEEPLWWKWVEKESAIIKDGTATFFDKTLPEFFTLVWHNITGETCVVEGNLKTFFVHTMPDFFKETGKEIEIVAEEIKNETLKDLRILENFIEDHCQCHDYSCGCCGHVEEDKIDLNATICVNVTYLRKDYGISFTMTLNHYVLYNETISARSPPPFCVGMPFVKDLAEVCVRLYDIDATSSYLHACVRVEGRMKKILVAKYDLGCFDMGHKAGHWLMKHERSADRCDLNRLPIIFNISYRLPELGNIVEKAIVRVPDLSWGVGQCTITHFALNVSWPSYKNDKWNVLRLTYEEGHGVNVNATVALESAIGNQTQLSAENNIPYLHIPSRLLRCCNPELPDKNETFSFALATFAQDEKMSDGTKDIVIFVGGGSFVIVMIILVIIAMRRWRCCCRQNQYIKF